MIISLNGWTIGPLIYLFITLNVLTVHPIYIIQVSSNQQELVYYDSISYDVKVHML